MRSTTLRTFCKSVLKRVEDDLFRLPIPRMIESKFLSDWRLWSGRLNLPPSLFY